MFLAIFLFIIGLAVLVAGAEFLVRGASSLAQKWGVPAIVIGLTIVAFGTSMPELVVNLFSAFRGATDIAIGNVIGSNTANILLILGITALIYPLSVKKNTTWKEIPFALLAVVLVFIMGNDRLFDGVDFKAFEGAELKSIATALMPYPDKVINILAGETGRTVEQIKELTVEQLIELITVIINHGIGQERARKAFFDLLTLAKAAGMISMK